MLHLPEIKYWENKMGLILGQAGLNIIKKYEGLRLTAYKAVSTEKYYTIGYGHYGPDVKRGMRITQAQAEAYLKSDCQTAVNAVNKYHVKYGFNQNQFDALVSFTYNCGAKNLGSLTALGLRQLKTIGTKITAYNKAGGKVLTGLVRRRQEEQALFFSILQAGTDMHSAYVSGGIDYTAVFDGTYYGTRYADLKPALGSDPVALFQHFLSFGMAEGRQGINSFSPQIYKARYADLQHALGDDWPAYYLHYIQHGKAEGRIAI